MCCFICLCVVRVNVFLSAGVADGKIPGPLAVDSVEGLRRVGIFDKGGCEAVLLTREPTFATVVDFGKVPSGRLDESVFVELDLFES